MGKTGKRVHLCVGIQEMESAKEEQLSFCMKAGKLQS